MKLQAGTEVVVTMCETKYDKDGDEYPQCFSEFTEEIDTDYYETSGELYKRLQQEYGRCSGKVYIDTVKGAKAIGWVFVKRAEYANAWRMREGKPRTYLQETWCSLRRKVEPAIPAQYDAVAV